MERYRQIHLDFHTSPHIGKVGENFDSEEFAARLKKAHVNSINLFAKCHHGYFYYPTEVGQLHPNLKNGLNLLGEQVKVCRENDIEVGVYTCVAWNELTADTHPEWQQVSTNGTLGITPPFSADYYKWQNVCINNPEYKELLKKELAEEAQLFNPDLFWVDIVVSNGCVCHHCRNEMKQMGLDPKNAEDVRRHDRLSEIRFMKEFYEYIKSLGDIRAYFNGFPAVPDLADEAEYSTARKRECMDCIDIESLPSDAWGYTHFPICANHINYKDKPIRMMNGKFHFAWGDFGSLRNLEALEYECFRALANGAHICIGDQMHPSGELCATAYERIGRVFEKIEQRELYIEGSQKISNIGVFTDNKVLSEIGESTEGVYRILTELNYLFDFIDCETDFARYNLIILPDCVKVMPELALRINTFIKNGGAVLLSGTSGVQNGQFVVETGVKYIGKSEFVPHYIGIEQDVFPKAAPMNHVFYSPAEKVEALQGTQVLSYVGNPYFNRTYDKFCSHRQTPIDKMTTEPAITLNGKVAYLSQPIFSEYCLYGARICKDIVKELLNRLMPSPLVKCELPNYVEVYLREKNGSKLLMLLNYIVQRKCKTIDTIEECVPLFDKVVFVKSETEPKKIQSVPGGAELSFEYDGEYIQMKLPEIGGFEMIEIKY